MCNEAGGVECDLTVTRLGDTRFLLVTGTAFGNHDLGWITAQLERHPLRDAVHARDVTSAWACYGVWGPRSRDVLASLSRADLGNEAFPYMTARRISVGAVPVIAVRVTYVGELGWELYCPTEYGLTLWDAIWEAGAEHGIVAGGYRAIDALRVEKGYRVWGADVTPDDNPYEAGLGFAVRLDKPTPFIGRDALRAAKAAGITRRLRAIVLADPAVGRARLGTGAHRRRNRRPGHERRIRLPRRRSRSRTRTCPPNGPSPAARSRSRCSAIGSAARSCATRCTTPPARASAASSQQLDVRLRP